MKICLVCICFFGFLIYLPFSLQDAPGYKIQMKGFRNYVQANVDVSAIREWLQTLDPNDCVELQYSDGYIITEPKRNGLKQVPFAIKKIGYPWLSLDRNNNPMLSFHWGSGMMGTWGFVIGKKGITISDSVPFWGMAFRNEEILDSETESTEEYEYREIVQDGVYIFHDL